MRPYFGLDAPCLPVADAADDALAFEDVMSEAHTPANGPAAGGWSALRSLAAAALFVVVAMAAVMASAQNLYWDPNGTATAAFSATGTWDGTTPNWNTDPLGGAGGTLGATTSASNNLFFSVPGSTGSPTITVSGTQSANSLTFDFSGGTATGANNNEDMVSLGGAAITLGGGTNPGIFVSAAPAGTTASGFVYTNSISSAITMASDLTIRNSGLTTFELKTGALTGSATNLTLQNNSNNFGGVIISSAVNIGGASTITNNGTGRAMAQIGGVVSGATNLVQDSPTSALWLNSANTTTGTATLKQGQLILANVNALNPVTSIAFQGGILAYRQGLAGVTDLSAKFTSNGADYKIELPTTGVVYATALAASASGNAGLRKFGQAQLTLTGANTYTGKTTIGGIDVANMQVAGGGTLTIGDGTNGSLNGNVGTDLDFQGTGVFEVKRAAASTQQMKQTTFSAGDGTVTSTQNTSATLTLASVSRSAGATGNFALSAGGGTPGLAGTNNIVITGQSTGTLGPGYFFGGSSYAFYDASGFVRAIDYNVDAGTADAAASGAAVSLPSKTYQQVTGAVSAQADGTSFTGLNIRNTSAATNPTLGNQGFTLASGATVTADGVLVSGGAGTGALVTISGGAGFRPQNNGELIVRTDATNDRLLIANLAANGMNSLTKSGAGTLVLSGANTLGGSGITGNVAINQGILVVSSTVNTAYSGITSGQGALHVAGGRTLTLNGSVPMAHTGGTVINNATVVADFSNLADPTNMLFTGTPGNKGTGVGSGAIVLGGSTGNFLRGAQGSGTLIIKGKPGASVSTYQQLGAYGTAGSGGSVQVQNGVGRVLADPNGGRDTTVVLSFPGATDGSVLVVGKAAGAGAGNVFFQSQGNSANSPHNAYGGNWGKLYYTTDGGISDLNFVVNVHYNSNATGASLFPVGTNGVNYADLIGGSGSFYRLTGASLALQPGGKFTTAASGTGFKLEDVRDGQELVFNGGGNGLGQSGLIMTGSEAGNFTISGGTIGGANTGLTNRISVFQMNPNMTLTFTNVFNATNSNNHFQKNGAGTVIFAGANVYSGSTFINEGKLVAGVAQNGTTSGPFGTTGTIRFSGGTLGFSAANATDYSARFSTTGMEPIRIDTAGQTVTFASNIQGVATTLTKLGSGTLVLNGANTYTGTTTFAGGNLRANAAETAGTSGPFGANSSAGALVFAGGTLQYSVSNTFDYSSRFSTAAGQSVSVDTNGQSVTFATGLSSPGGTLTKAGSGRLTLTTDNTYSGATTVSEGTLALDSAGTIANSPTIMIGANGMFDVAAKGYGGLTVAQNQELKGDGLVTGNVVMGAGSVITPGADVGVLSFDGNLTLSATSVFNFQLGSSATPGTTYDQIKVVSLTGFNLLDIGSELINFSNFNFTALPGFGEGTYTLFDAGTSGTLGSTLTGQIGAYPGTISTDPFTSAVVLTVFAAVPEPGTVALLSVAGLAAAATALRRRSTLPGIGSPARATSASSPR